MKRFPVFRMTVSHTNYLIGHQWNFLSKNETIILKIFDQRTSFMISLSGCLSNTEISWLTLLYKGVRFMSFH